MIIQRTPIETGSASGGNIFFTQSTHTWCLIQNAATPGTASYNRISCPSIGRMTSLWQRTEINNGVCVVAMPKIKQSTPIADIIDISAVPIATKHGVTERWEIFSFMIVELHRTVSVIVVADRIDFGCKYAAHSGVCIIIAHKILMGLGIGWMIIRNKTRNRSGSALYVHYLNFRWNVKYIYIIFLNNWRVSP